MKCEEEEEEEEEEHHRRNKNPAKYVRWYQLKIVNSYSETSQTPEIERLAKNC